MATVLCPLKRCRTPLNVTTQDGRLVVEECPVCARRRRGICKDCELPVYGTIGKAVRCEMHARLKRLEDTERHRKDPDVKKKINRRNRRRYHDPSTGVGDAKRLARRAWGERNRDKVRKRMRTLRKGTGPSSKRYWERQKKYEEQPGRIAKKRKRALAAYYRHRMLRMPPICRECGTPVEWNGKGRPSTLCDKHCSRRELARRMARRVVEHVHVPAVNDISRQTAANAAKRTTGEKHA